MKATDSRLIDTFATAYDSRSGTKGNVTTQDGDKLTPRQEGILAWMKAFMVEHIRPPSIREIMAHFGIRSPNGMVCHLDALVAKGYITHTPGSSRGYIPVGAKVVFENGKEEGHA